MGRSLCVAPSHIARVKQALKNSSHPSQQSLATHCGLGRDTARKFFNGEPIDRNNFVEFCERLNLDWEEIVKEDSDEDKDPDFVGRKGAIAYLDQLRQEGKTCVLMQGAGGVGKTVLAERYLAGRFPGRLVRFDVAKEKQAVGSASGLLELRLGDLGVEPGREFAVSCDRLRHKLKTEAYGVLVDNLETALDGRGRLIPEHRDYVELLRVLSDTSLKSFTLITSRERVSEGLNIEFYRLECLDVEAWQDYFGQKKLTVVLEEMHKAYRGNALGMQVLRGRIVEDYQGNLERYWAEHQTPDGLVVEQAMENLITQQFERLQQVNLNAYNLLCRMGCFRYQDVPTVPREGLFCLLWEVPQNKAQKAIDTLRDLALVDRVDGEYRLHPLIKEQAIEQLRNSKDWKRANQKAAEFWTDSVKTVENVVDAITAFEAYHHYTAIHDFEKAAQIILKPRVNKWNDFYNGDPLGRSFYRLSLFNKIAVIDENSKNISTLEFRVVIYNILGDLYGSRGWIKTAIDYHNSCRKYAEQIKFFEYILYSENNLAWCDIRLAKYQESISRSEQAILLLEEIGKTKTVSEYIVLINKIHADSCIAFCKSCSKNDDFNQSIKLADQIYNSLEKLEFHAWGEGWNYLMLGSTYKNLGVFERAYELFYRSIDTVKESQYIQLQARAITGLAELDRIHHKFDEALLKHKESIQTLERLDAECDLAEAYYQIALTYQAMGDTPNSQDYFNQSIALWQKIDAPKQIERIEKSMNTPLQ